MSDSANQLPEDFELPAGLAGDLKSLYAHTPMVPAEVDRAILSRIPAHMARVKRLRLWIGWGGAAAAIAAMALVAIRLIPRTPTYHEGQRVTILDAFSLARQLKSGKTPDRSWDVNHDGKVDQADVDALAMRAVSLSGTAGGGQ